MCISSQKRDGRSRKNTFPDFRCKYVGRVADVLVLVRRHFVDKESRRSRLDFFFFFKKTFRSKGIVAGRETVISRIFAISRHKFVLFALSTFFFVGVRSLKTSSIKLAGRRCQRSFCTSDIIWDFLNSKRERRMKFTTGRRTIQRIIQWRKN